MNLSKRSFLGWAIGAFAAALGWKARDATHEFEAMKGAAINWSTAAVQIGDGPDSLIVHSGRIHSVKVRSDGRWLQADEYRVNEKRGTVTLLA